MKFLDEIRSSIAAKEQTLRSLKANVDRLERDREAGGRKTFTPGQQAQMTAVQAEIAEVETDLDALRAREAELEEVERRNLNASVVPTGKPIVSASDRGDVFSRSVDVLHAEPITLRSAAMRAIDGCNAPDWAKEGLHKSLSRAGNVGEPQADATAAWMVAASDPAYFRAWSKVTMDPHGAALLSDEERTAFQRADVAYRAMNITTGADGKLGLPVIIDPTFILSNDGYIPLMRRLAKITPIMTDRWKGITTPGVTASWHTENTAVSVTQPTLVQPDIPVHANSVFVEFSFEVGQDYPDLVSELAKIATDAVYDLEEAAFWNGTGSGEPTGLVYLLDSSTGVEVTVDTPGTLTKGDFYDVASAVPDRFWNAASWAANRSTWFQVRQFADTTTGANNAAFWADMGAANPSTLLGKAVYETSELSGFAATTGAQNVAVVGDFSNYRIVERSSQSEVVPHLFDTTTNRPTLTRGFLLWRRVGGAPTVLNGFRLLNQ